MKNNKFIFGCVILTVFSFIFGCKLDTEKPVYTITYQSEKGNLPDSKQVEDGYVLTEEDLPTLTADGYTFKGWDKAEGDVITEDTTITASWDKVPAKTPEDDSSNNPANDPSKDPANDPSKDPSKTADPVMYTITYKSEKGTAPVSKKVEEGYALKAEDLPALTDEDYDFTGWDKAAGDKITADTTITASWKIKQVRIIYSSVYGTAPETKTVDKGYALKAEDLPALTDKYYDFKGWNSAAGNVITADTTITASWQIRSCTVTYSSTLTGDGTKQIPATFTKDAGYKLTKEDLPFLGKDTVSGKLFVGWGKSFGDEITNDITLTAEWQDEVYLSFGDNFGAFLNGAAESLSVIFQKEPYEGDYKETYDCSTSNSYYTSYLTNDNKLIISGNGHKIVFPVNSNFLFSNYDNGGKISSFTFNNDCITSYVNFMACMFSHCSSITSIDMSNLDTSNVTNMGQMFEFCENLKTVNIGKTSATNMYRMFYECWHIEKVILDTSSATDMEGMFYSCQYTESIDISGFDTSSATKMKYMFSSCNNLKTVDLSGFNTSNVTKMDCMFNQCGKLETLDLSGFDTQKVTDMEQMFLRCNKLKTLDLSSFDTQNVTYMKEMFSECTNLETIYASDTFTVKNEADTSNMFCKCTSLVGGNGTKCNDAEDSNGKAHACIDGGRTKPGYFTRKQ